MHDRAHTFGLLFSRRNTSLTFILPPILSKKLFSSSRTKSTLSFTSSNSKSPLDLIRSVIGPFSKSQDLISLSSLRYMKYKKWECIVCGLIYDEELGWPEDGIEPGTAWEDVPEDWLCPECGVGKEDFDMIEIT